MTGLVNDRFGWSSDGPVSVTPEKSGHVQISGIGRIASIRHPQPVESFNIPSGSFLSFESHTTDRAARNPECPTFKTISTVLTISFGMGNS